MKAATTRKAAALAFATKLNALLAEKGISRRELARRWVANSDGMEFETARTNVLRLLRADHVPNESTRREVAAALEVDASEFEEEALLGDPFRGADAAAPSRRRRGGGRGAGEPGAEVAA